MSERKQPGGLFVGEQRIPLRGVKIDVKASGAAAQVTVAQRYENTEKVPVEAVYSFPLEDNLHSFVVGRNRICRGRDAHIHLHGNSRRSAANPLSRAVARNKACPLAGRLLKAAIK